MQELINIPEYWQCRSVRPRGFTELCDMIETEGRVTGIWMWEQWNPKTGEVTKRQITKNVVTDAGAVAILQGSIANAVPASVFNNIYINNNSGSTRLTSASGAGAIATGANLAVSSLPAQVPLNYPAPANAVVTQLALGYGTGTTQTISMNATTAQGATALNIVGFTPSINFPVGTPVVPLPNVQENPSNANLKANQSTVVEAYSGNLSAGAFTYSATTGLGNRSVTVTFVFRNSTNGGTCPNGAFTDSWLVNVSTGATTNNFIAHEVNDPMFVNDFNNATVTITIRI